MFLSGQMGVENALLAGKGIKFCVGPAQHNAQHIPQMGSTQRRRMSVVDTAQ